MTNERTSINNLKEWGREWLGHFKPSQLAELYADLAEEYMDPGVNNQGREPLAFKMAIILETLTQLEGMEAATARIHNACIVVHPAAPSRAEVDPHPQCGPKQCSREWVDVPPDYSRMAAAMRLLADKMTQEEMIDNVPLFSDLSTSEVAQMLRDGVSNETILDRAVVRPEEE